MVNAGDAKLGMVTRVEGRIITNDPSRRNWGENWSSTAVTGKIDPVSHQEGAAEAKYLSAIYGQ